MFYPPAMGVFALCILLALMAPFTGSISGPVRLGVAGLGGLAAWTLLSAFWSATPSTAVEDALRVFLYLGVFVAGLWTVHLLGRRMLLALAPVAAAGAIVAVVATFVLLTGDDYQAYLHPDSTLRLPIGYRNANAAFFLICCWPLLVLAAQSALRWELRVLSVGATTVLLDLVVLSQSRGSLPAAAFALLAYVAFSPHRLRAGVVAALAVLPVLSVLPALLDVFQHGEADAASVDVLRDAGRAMVLSGLFSMILATLALRVVDPNLSLGREQVQRISRVAAALAVVVVIAGLGVFVAERGGPVEFVDQRVSEFERGGDPDFSQEGQRFGANIGSNRRDFWRVALAKRGRLAAGWERRRLLFRRLSARARQRRDARGSPQPRVAAFLRAWPRGACPVRGIRGRRRPGGGAVLAPGPGEPPRWSPPRWPRARAGSFRRPMTGSGTTRR